MRFNRGTVVLLVVSLVVIVAVLLLLTNQAAAPGSDTLTPTGAAGGPLFPGVTVDTVVRFEVRDNTTGQRLAITRSEGSEWNIDDQTNDQTNEGMAQDNTDAIPTEASTGDLNVATSGFPVDQEAAASNLDSFLSLAADDSFTSTDLAQFGLAQPRYSVFAVNNDEAVYVMHIGSENPSGTRYYAVAAQIGAADTSPQAQSMRPSLERLDIETSLTGDNAAITPEAAATSDLAAVEIEGEATDAVAGDNDMQPDLNLPNIETSLDEETPVVEVEAEGTAGVEEGVAEATEEGIEDAALPEGTVEPVAINPVQLSGEQTILLVPSSTIDTLVALMSAPPVIIPTATPTPFPTANPVSEVDQTATAAAQSTTSAISTQLAAMAAATAEATPEATGEAAGEATEPAVEATTAP